MHNIIFLLTALSSHVDTIKANFQVYLHQNKETNNIFSEYVLCFSEEQDEDILHDKLQSLNLDVFLLECLY